MKSKKKTQPEPSHEDRLMQLNELLLQNIKARLPELEKLLEEVNGHWGVEDLFYRLYHQSFKVYDIQGITERVAKALRELDPKETHKFDSYFEKIIKEGTGKTFKSEYNDNWLKHTGPLVEAAFHAKYFLEMIVKYGKELDKAPECLPSGWAAVTTLFIIR